MSEVSLYCRVLGGCTYRLNTDEFILHDGDPLLRQIYLKYRGTSLIRNSALLEPYSRTMPS